MSSRYLDTQAIERELKAALEEFQISIQEIEQRTGDLERDFIQVLEVEKMKRAKKKLGTV